MANNKAIYLNDGLAVAYKATDAPVDFMDIVTLDKRIGVAQEPIAQGQVGSVQIVGAFMLPKDKAAEFKAGATVFYESGAVKAEGTVVAGTALEDGTNGATAIAVRIG